MNDVKGYCAYLLVVLYFENTRKTKSLTNKQNFKMINKLKYIFAILLFWACTKKITKLEEYSNYPIKYGKTKIIHPENDFSITIPKNWEWKAEEYNNPQIILGMDIGATDSITKFTKIISIQKYKSFEKNMELLDEFKTIQKNIKKSSLMPTIIESGYTKNLKYDSYYIYQKLEGSNSIEMISFILKGKEKETFYSLTTSCQSEDNIETNFALMIKCIESFEIN